MTVLDEQEQCAKLRAEHGWGRKKIAAHLGWPQARVQRRLQGWDKRAKLDPALLHNLDTAGIHDLAGLHSGWLKDENKSLYFYFGQDEPTSFIDAVTDALADYKPLDRKLFAPRVNTGDKGDKLAVIDLADVHFGKLATMEETGGTYNIEVARHRVIEGTRALLRQAMASDVGHILFVMGNDILHTDNGKTSTSGTGQDTDSSYFNAWRAAQHASIDAISECAALANVDLLHCMSNHDWRSGWALSQTIAASLSNHPQVRATPYNMSEKHLKFYGYGRNGLALTHGDGAKEEAISSLFLKQGKPLVGNCDLLYAYLHHFHHKIRNRRGVDVFQSEKDHTAFTQINFGASAVESGGLVAEYVRSPSAPDGWHDRQGFVNRQAVEMFIHCPHDGQKARFTEWF